MASRKPVLADHKKSGKKLLPPITSQMGDRLQLTSWPRAGIPELLWLALLHDVDEELGVKAADALAAAARKVNAKVPFCFVSHFDMVENQAIWQQIEKEDQVVLEFALQPLVVAYPTCPLRKMLPIVTQAADLERLKRVVDSLFDKTSRASTMALASMMYIIIHARLFFLHPESRLKDLEGIREYPDTEKSRSMASELRAVSIMWFMPPQYKEPRWPNEFWNRGLELEPCAYE